MYVEERPTLSVFLYSSPYYFLRQGLSLNLELTDLTGPAGQQAPGTICPYLPSSESTNAYAYFLKSEF